MKKFKKDQLPRKGKKLALNRETIKDLTLRTQVTGGAARVSDNCYPAQTHSCQ